MLKVHGFVCASLIMVFAVDAAAQSDAPWSVPPVDASSSSPSSVAPSAPTSVEPRLVHVPLLAARSEVPTVLRLDVTEADRVASVDVYVRALPDPPWLHLVAARASDVGYVVTIPAQPARVRAIVYYVRVRTVDGHALEAFATESEPHLVVMRPSGDAEREQFELAAHAGQRLEFSAGGEYTNFGDRSAVHCNSSSSTCRDYWYSLFGGVQYHFYRAVRSVSVRVERVAGTTTRMPNGVAAQQDIGLVAATSSLEFRLAPAVSFSISGILGANQTAVTGGGGAMFEFGVDTPTRVQVGWSGVIDYGMTASAWMRFYTIPELPFGAGVEVTNQPAGSGPFGVRLLLEASHPIGRYFSVTARGGYGARALDAGGFTGGGTVQLHF